MFIIHSKYNKPQNMLTVNPLSRPKGAYLFQAHLRWGGGGGGIWDGWLTLFSKDDGINILPKN